MCARQLICVLIAVGALMYLSPELVESARNVANPIKGTVLMPSDMWAFGSLTYVVITGASLSLCDVVETRPCGVVVVASIQKQPCSTCRRCLAVRYSVLALTRGLLAS